MHMMTWHVLGFKTPEVFHTHIGLRTRQGVQPHVALDHVVTCQRNEETYRKRVLWDNEPHQVEGDEGDNL